MLNKANLVGIFIERNKELRLLENLPVSYLDSKEELKRDNYKWVGYLLVEEIKNKDILVVIKSIAYRARHEETGRVIKLRNAGYKHKETGEYYGYNLMGIIRKNRLYLLINKASESIKDIAPFAPVRATNIKQAYSRLEKFSSSK